MIVTCKRFVETITAEREGALPEWERKHWHEHVSVCGPCRSYLDGFERTLALVHEVGTPRPTEPLRATLLARFRQRTARPGDEG